MISSFELNLLHCVSGLVLAIGFGLVADFMYRNWKRDPRESGRTKETL